MKHLPSIGAIAIDFLESLCWPLTRQSLFLAIEDLDRMLLVANFSDPFSFSATSSPLWTAAAWTCSQLNHPSLRQHLVHMTEHLEHVGQSPQICTAGNGVTSKSILFFCCLNQKNLLHVISRMLRDNKNYMGQAPT